MTTIDVNPFPTVTPYSIDYEGRGIAKLNGKTLFIEGALPGERVTCRITRTKKHFDEAETLSIYHPSPQRTIPICPHFGTCGGCTLQHIEASAQTAFKQRIMEEQLARLGKISAEQILPPIYGLPWAYRQRARLSIGQDPDGRLTLGFRARKSHQIINIQQCPILPDHVSSILPPLQSFLSTVHAKTGLLHLEFSIGEELTALTFASKQPLSQPLLNDLKTFSDRHLNTKHHHWQIWLQTNQSPAMPFYPQNAPELYYSLPEFDLRIPYRPGDFTQVNNHLNALMVQRAVRMLAPQPGEHIADLFCGLGNFTLALARSGAHVTGMEGSAALVARAQANANLNGLAAHTQFKHTDLFQTTPDTLASWGKFDKMLLDPPRDGAHDVVQALHAPYLPQKLVYVSCNPATFARDAAILVKKGYKFKEVSAMNLFAQTSHIESIGCFEK